MLLLATFDQGGEVDFSATLKEYEEAYTGLAVAATTRMERNLVDTTARTGYEMMDVNPKTPHQMAAEYYTFDWEYAQTPEVQFHLIITTGFSTYRSTVAIIMDCFILGK